MGHHQIHHHHHPQVVHHQTTPHGTVVPGGHYGGNPGMMQLAGPPHVPTVTTTGTNPAHHTNGPSATTRNAIPTVPGERKRVQGGVHQGRHQHHLRMNQHRHHHPMFSLQCLWPQQDLRKMECHDSRMVH